MKAAPVSGMPRIAVTENGWLVLHDNQSDEEIEEESPISISVVADPVALAAEPNDALPARVLHYQAVLQRQPCECDV